MLVLKNIVKDYVTGDTTVRALKGIDISFRENEFVAVLGPSGCGKTTLLNIVGGLDRYTSGDLLINGKSTKYFNDGDWDTYRNHSIGFVFQSYNLIPHQTVLSNVELALTLSGVSKKERKKRAIEALKKVGLEQQIYKKPNQMSGGQMQRVAIARALINDPDILLADEPTGALDSETSVQIMDLLKEIAKEKLIIMVTHNPELADSYANRIISCLDGEVVGDTNPYEPTEKDIEEQKIKVQNAKVKGKKTMSFGSAFALSINNLRTKKGRTFLTAFAGSIGIIGIALVLALSNGIQVYIDRVQEDMLLSYPMTVEKQTMDFESIMSSFTGITSEAVEGTDADEGKVYVNESFMQMVNAFISESTSNNLDNFKKYIEDNQEEFDKCCNDVQYRYSTQLNIYRADTDDGVIKVNPSTMMESMPMDESMQGMASSMSSMTQSFSVWMELIGDDKLMEAQYDVIAGRMPNNYNEVVLIVDGNNQINELVVYALGLKDQEEFTKDIMAALVSGETLEDETVTEYTYDDILNMKFKLVLSADYFVKDEKTGLWRDNSENDYYVKQLVEDGEEIKIVGILKPDENNTLSIGTGGIGYTRDLMDYAIEQTSKRQVVKQQLNDKTRDVITGYEFSTLTVNDFDLADVDLSIIDYTYLDYKPFLEMAEGMDMAEVDMTDMGAMFGFDDMSELQKKLMEGFLTDEQVLALKQAYVDTLAANSSYEGTLLKLGYSTFESPSSIAFYPKSFEDKEKLNELVEYYNQQVTADGHEEAQIKVTDYIGLLMSSITTIIDVVTYVLVAFVAISLVVSSIMIGIITYISVLERTKEIGILRSIGASKKDIARVFNAETAVIGLGAGIIGILSTLLLEIPINLALKYLVHIPAAASLPFVGGVVLVIISISLTLIAGLIPSRMAAKKDPVEALRTE
ncbi:MAG: ABC transporter ATP-binding protein/permease [Ruminococcaceae bacterium]|nr:ABC transporter ATP-binding protein/permease [Oscillospiraceae bacterium]